MSSKVKLKATAGGSLSLIVNDTLTTDEEIEVPSEGVYGKNEVYTKSEVYTKGEVDVDAYGVERGSNANGFWVKYPDGTMEAYGGVTENGVACSTASGALYRSVSAAFTITFPITFVGTYVCTITPHQEISVISITPYNPTQSSTGTIITTVSSIASLDITVRYHIIGRWK